MRSVLMIVLVGPPACTGSSTRGTAEPVADANLSDAPADASAEVPADAPADARADGPVECFGTMYPGIGPIDPDAPVFSDADWTQEEVTSAFLEAKAQNSDAYRAYKAALQLGDILECAFCPCGCNASIGHLSSADCYKDMHGFG